MSVVKRNTVLLFASSIFIIVGICNLYHSKKTSDRNDGYIIHMRINSNAENINELINSLPDNLIMHDNPKRWLLLFLTTANQCGNCMNEINDYLDIAKNNNITNNHFSSFIFYHGLDSLKSRRFALTSDLYEIVDGAKYISTSKLIDQGIINLFPDYEYANILLLFDMRKKIAFHLFILPTLVTTKHSSKEFAFRFAINNHLEMKIGEIHEN